MSVRVRLISEWGGYQPGRVLDAAGGVADLLLRRKLAVLVEEPAPYKAKREALAQRTAARQRDASKRAGAPPKPRAAAPSGRPRGRPARVRV